MRSSSLAALVGMAIAVAVPRVALADCLIVEAHVGERPADADEILEPFKEPLKAMGCRDAREVVHELENVSRPGMQVDSDTLKTYEDKVRDGFQKYRDLEYEAAIKVLEPLVKIAEDNPAAMVGQPNLRSSHRLALIGMAMAHRKQSLQAASEADAAERLARSRKARKQEAAELIDQAAKARTHAAELMKRATELMGGVARTFSTREIQRSELGGETFDFYEEAKKELHARGLVKLKFLLDDASGILYVNGEYADVGKIDMEVLPGPTSILIRWGSGPNATVRFYRRTLRSGVQVTHARRRFEETLHTGRDWCCLLYPSIAIRDEHIGYDVSPFNRGDDRVMVMGIQPGTKGSPRTVIGQVHGLGDIDKAKRRVRLPVEPVLPRRQYRIEVGKYWAGQRDDVPRPGPEDAAWARSGQTSLALKLSLVGAGIASGLVGGYLLHQRNACGMVEGCARTTKIGGGMLIGAGAVALAAAVYLQVRDRRRQRIVNEGLSLALGQGTMNIGWSRSF
jgi:hypothetical protein